MSLTFEIVQWGTSANTTPNGAGAPRKTDLDKANQRELERSAAIRAVRNFGITKAESHPFDPLDGIDTPLEDWDREFERRTGHLPGFSPVHYAEALKRAQAFGYKDTSAEPMTDRN